MVLNSKTLFPIALLLGSLSVQAENDFYSEAYLTLKDVEVREITRDVLNQETFRRIHRKDFDTDRPRGRNFPDGARQIDPLDRAGKVIKVARDLVALGEDVYKLVQKGRPNNDVNYAPISVVPKIDGEPVDVFATENWKTPRQKTYEIVYKNLMNVEVVKFRYSVVFSYGGTYQGAGSYLTSAQIIPVSVNTLFGFDFSATMKLGGIQNNATRENPIAAANLLVEYSVRNVLQARLEVDTFHITGRGGLKKL